MATGSDYQENEYRRVTNIDTDSDSVVYILHPGSCRGGSHYYAIFGHYYIVFADRGVLKMNTNEGAVKYSTHSISGI